MKVTSKHKFSNMALNKNSEMLVIHVLAIRALESNIYLFHAFLHTAL